MRVIGGIVAVVLLIAGAEAGLRADSGERLTSLADQRAVTLTIYNAGIALVRERRHVPLEQGLNHVAWRDVSAQLDPTSVLLESASGAGNVSVIEQNFNFDLLRPQTLLDKYVGRDVTVVHDHATAGHPLRETARVLSTNDGIVLQYADRIETSIDGHLTFPSIPENLRDRPTLVLDLQSGSTRSDDLELSYLSNGLTWRADYVGLVSPGDDRLDLSGLVTLSNTSGATYRNAKLQLVAGNVNVAPSTLPMLRVNIVAMGKSEDAFQQQNFFEYHLYTLTRPTTIADNQTKQISLLSAHSIHTRKTLELRGQSSYYTSSESDLGDKIPVGVYFSFVNRGGELGIPLPAGIVRLYKRDSSGSSLFLGSDNIDHTPKNESVRLHLGDSFDVTAHKRQTDFQQRLLVAGRPYVQSSYQIVIKNAKPQAAEVLVVEPIPGEWQIVAENQKHIKSSSASATWTVRVPAGGQATLTYTARTFIG